MKTIGLQLALQVFLIVLNAYFAATEIAVISLNATKLRKMAEEGDRSAPRLLKLVEEPSGFLSTIQVGITLAGFLGSAFAADGFSGYIVDWVYNDLGFHAVTMETLQMISVIVITLILSFFTLIFGELVPKRVAMQRAMQVAKFTAPVVSAISIVMKPVIWLLSASTNGVLRLMGLKTEAEEDNVTEDEIRMMVELGSAKGAIDKSEEEWIQNVFDFGDITARDAMTHETSVISFSVSTDDETIRRIIREGGVSRIPVYEKDIHSVLGILNVRDFLLDRDTDSPRPLRELLRPAYFVPETIHASQLFKDMQTKKIHMAVVVDEYGDTAGVVTIEDLLEEIVGNIYDEFDQDEQEKIIKLQDNLWRIAGSARIDHISEELDIDLPNDTDYDTLGGMVISQLRTIPQDGSQLDVEYCGLMIHVERVQNRRIEEAVVRKLDPSREDEAE